MAALMAAALLPQKMRKYKEYIDSGDQESAKAKLLELHSLFIECVAENLFNQEVSSYFASEILKLENYKPIIDDQHFLNEILIRINH